MSGRLMELKYPIIIVNVERTSRKTYLTHPHLEEAVEKANKFGCPGNILLHDADGAEICDDEVLEFLLQSKTKFMICNKCSDWTPENAPEVSHEMEEKVEPQIQIAEVKSNYCTNITATPKDIVRYINHPEFATFSIPWQKVSPFIMHLLETEQPLHRNVNALANLFIDELLLIKPTVPIPIMRKVAEQAVSRYPASFSNHGTDKNLSEDIDIFLSILKYRYFGLKRGKVKSKKQEIKSVNGNSSEFNILSELCTDVKVEFDSVSSDE